MNNCYNCFKVVDLGMTNEAMKTHCTDECASGYNPNCTCENI